MLVQYARYFATTKHTTQLYDGSLPYAHHLAAVEREVRRWFPPYSVGSANIHSHYHIENEAWHEAWLKHVVEETALRKPPELLETLMAAAWLHDLVEDCGVQLVELVERFGPIIARIVWAVTNEPGANRAARHAATYPKIRTFGPALFLKLCDRIANVEQGGSLISMYRKEHEDFKRALYIPHLFDAMWTHLDDLLRLKS